MECTVGEHFGIGLQFVTVGPSLTKKDRRRIEMIRTSAIVLALVMFVACVSKAQAQVKFDTTVNANDAKDEAATPAPVKAPPLKAEAKKTIGEEVGGGVKVAKELIRFRNAGGNFRNLVQAGKNLKAEVTPVTAENLALEWMGNTATEKELGGFFDNFTLDDLIKLLEVLLPFIMLFL